MHTSRTTESIVLMLYSSDLEISSTVPTRSTYTTGLLKSLAQRPEASTVSLVGLPKLKVPCLTDNRQNLGSHSKETVFKFQSVQFLLYFSKFLLLWNFGVLRQQRCMHMRTRTHTHMRTQTRALALQSRLFCQVRGSVCLWSSYTDPCVLNNSL